MLLGCRLIIQREVRPKLLNLFMFLYNVIFFYIMLSLLRLNLIKLKYNYLTNAKKKLKKPVRDEFLK
jgi:hypothetical protein